MELAHESVYVVHLQKEKARERTSYLFREKNE